MCSPGSIGDDAFVERVMQLKEEDTFDKIDRTVELLGPSQSFTGFQLTRACLNPMMGYLGRGMDFFGEAFLMMELPRRGMDASPTTLPFFMRFDEKILDLSRHSSDMARNGPQTIWPTSEEARGS